MARMRPLDMLKKLSEDAYAADDHPSKTLVVLGFLLQRKFPKRDDANSRAVSSSSASRSPLGTIGWGGALGC